MILAWTNKQSFKYKVALIWDSLMGVPQFMKDSKRRKSDLFVFIDTEGLEFISHLKDFCSVCTEFDCREILGWAQSLISL